MRQYSCTTYVLVRFTSIDTQVNGNVNAFNELGGSQFFQQGNGFVDGVLFGTINFSRITRMRLVSLAIVLFLPLPGPWNGRTFDGTYFRIQIGTSHVRLFGLGDFQQLSASHPTNLVFVRLTEPDWMPAAFFSRNRSRAESWFRR